MAPSLRNLACRAWCLLTRRRGAGASDEALRSQVWISYDGDAPARRPPAVLDMLEPAGLKARVIDIWGMDGRLCRGAAGFAALKKYDAVEYRMLRARDGVDVNTQDGMTQYVLRCCQILRGVRSPVELENHLRRLAAESGYDREILLRQVGASLPAQPGAPRPRLRVRQEEVGAAQTAQSALLTLLCEGRIPPETVEPGDFDAGALRDCAAWLIEGKAVNAFLEQ
ncbi:MAG: hypothetical protein ACLUI3_17700 [Christensenellales bacterium]